MGWEFLCISGVIRTGVDCRIFWAVAIGRCDSVNFRVRGVGAIAGGVILTFA